MRCDKCGRFCKELFDVPSAYPGGGIDYEICRRCAEEPASRARIASVGGVS